VERHVIFGEDNVVVWEGNMRHSVCRRPQSIGGGGVVFGGGDTMFMKGNRVVGRGEGHMVVGR
jgi:hypothetical protein